MARKIIVLDAPVKNHPKKTSVWWKIGRHFINQENVRSIRRRGRTSVISLFQGDDLLVNIKYDKLEVLLPSDKTKI